MKIETIAELGAFIREEQCSFYASCSHKTWRVGMNGRGIAVEGRGRLFTDALVDTIAKYEAECDRRKSAT